MISRRALYKKFITFQGYHIEKKNVKYLHITRYTLEKTSVAKKFIFDLNYTYISAMEAHIIINMKFTYY